MSDASPTAVTFEKALEFLKAKTSNRSCAECNSDDLGIFAAEADHAFKTKYPGLAVVDITGELYVQGYMPLIGVRCNNCGAIRLHDVRVMAAHFDKLKEADGG